MRSYYNFIATGKTQIIKSNKIKKLWKRSKFQFNKNNNLQAEKV